MTLADRGHVPVLLTETVAALAPHAGETLIDCTAGLGGHASAIAQVMGPNGRVLLLDADPANLERATSEVRTIPAGPAVTAIHANFALVEALARREGIVADMILADLGVASSQLNDPKRGLSFTGDGPLDMRFDPTLVGTAADLVNALTERKLADLIFRFGEDPFARRIASRIVAARAMTPIQSTAQLAEVVRDAYGSRAHASRMHPATRTFMALRIAVNDELGALERLLDAIDRAARQAMIAPGRWLAPACRIAIISFHSLEDRLVKHRFRELARGGFGIELSKRPVEATAEESQRNPRSRSAKLRVLHLVGRC